MIHGRYAAVTAIVLALALVPTTIHTYMGEVKVDGLTTGAIAEALAGLSSTPTPRKAAWVKNNLESEDWIERVYGDGANRVTLFVARSYDAKRLYHHPELALLRGTETRPAGIARATERPEVPLHLLTTAKDGATGIAAYALLYDGRFVADPIMFQLRTAVELLFSRRKPLTIFMASDLSGKASSINDAPATRVLLAALGAFEAQPSGATAPTPAIPTR